MAAKKAPSPNGEGAFSIPAGVAAPVPAPFGRGVRVPSQAQKGGEGQQQRPRRQNRRRPPPRAEEPVNPRCPGNQGLHLSPDVSGGKKGFRLLSLPVAPGDEVPVHDAYQPGKGSVPAEHRFPHLEKRSSPNQNQAAFG